jgi:hypothetical protein
VFVWSPAGKIQSCLGTAILVDTRETSQREISHFSDHQISQGEFSSACSGCRVFVCSFCNQAAVIQTSSTFGVYHPDQSIKEENHSSQGKFSNACSYCSVFVSFVVQQQSSRHLPHWEHIIRIRFFAYLFQLLAYIDVCIPVPI